MEVIVLGVDLKTTLFATNKTIVLLKSTSDMTNIIIAIMLNNFSLPRTMFM